MADKTRIQPRFISKKRGNTTEEVAENLIKAQNKIKQNKKNEQKITLKSNFNNRLKKIYNRELGEFLSRDALGWFKLIAFYTFFYSFLAGFFILLLVAFYQTIDPKQPTYCNVESAMHYLGVNPGLGFRPQIDPENNLIYINASDFTSIKKSLETFLNDYDKNDTFFDYEKITEYSPCSKANNFSYNTISPCVLVKLNRIYGWIPEYSSYLPEDYKINVTEAHLGLNDADKYVYVLCDGENAADKDNIYEINYYSSLASRKLGGIHFKYFPYRNQINYLSPLVFVHFKRVAQNVLINVECRAYAANIENTDRLNKRGMVKFQLFVTK